MNENVEISGIEPQTLVRYCQDGGCWGLEAHQVQPLVKAPLTAEKEVPILGAKRRGSRCWRRQHQHLGLRHLDVTVNPQVDEVSPGRAHIRTRTPGRAQAGMGPQHVRSCRARGYSGADPAKAPSGLGPRGSRGCARLHHWRFLESPIKSGHYLYMTTQELSPASNGSVSGNKISQGTGVFSGWSLK